VQGYLVVCFCSVAANNDKKVLCFISLSNFPYTCYFTEFFAAFRCIMQMGTHNILDKIDSIQA